jgi:isopenicillin-N epimerase
VAVTKARFGRAARADWALDPDVVYLNHGTVGVVPLRVLEAQQALRLEIERQPSRFLLRELAWLPGVNASDGVPRLRAAAAAVGAFLGARGEDVVFVDNATSGANAVLRSLPLRAGDEILVTDHGYHGVTLVAEFAARETGAKVVTAELPGKGGTDEEVVEAIAGRFSDRTRLLLVDHLTSEMARILPLAAIATRAREAGVPVLADGAHVPGMLPLDIDSLGVDWYCGNLHKWAWAPRGTGILWSRPDHQEGLHPPAVSWGLDKGYTAEFDWTGTRDSSGWLTAPFAIQLMEEIGVDAIRDHNHGLAWAAAGMLADAWGVELDGEESWYGAMVTVPLPPELGTTPEEGKRLRDALLFEDQIEVAVSARGGRLRVRLCAQVYNDMADMERLAEAVTGRRHRVQR